MKGESEIDHRVEYGASEEQTNRTRNDELAFAGDVDAQRARRTDEMFEKETRGEGTNLRSLEHTTMFRLENLAMRATEARSTKAQQRLGELKTTAQGEALELERQHQQLADEAAAALQRLEDFERDKLDMPAENPAEEAGAS